MTTPEHDGAGPLDRSDPLPLWAQMAQDLRRRISAGAFMERFPTEAEIGGEYGVSRHTVREALRRLREEGVVVSERGRGSHLAASRFEQPLGAISSLYETIESQGIEQGSEVRRLETTRDPAIAAQLELAPEAELVVVERLRLADGEPLALDTAWLPATIAGPLLDSDLSDAALYAELARTCDVRVDAGRERITPVVPSEDVAALLALEPGAAAFRVLRRASAAGRGVEVRETLVRGDRYCLAASWSAAMPYELGLRPAG